MLMKVLWQQTHFVIRGTSKCESLKISALKKCEWFCNFKLRPGNTLAISDEQNAHEKQGKNATN